MAYWLLKTEPTTFAYQDLVRLGRDHWDGVRNYTARNYLRAMQPGDWALIYHSVKDKEIVGVAKIVSAAYPDPTTDDERWSAVTVEAAYPFQRPVPLAAIKADARYADFPLVRQGRLSVMPVSPEQWQHLHELGATPCLPDDAM